MGKDGEISLRLAVTEAAKAYDDLGYEGTRRVDVSRGVG
jgi:hypothetical protein